LGEKYSFLIMGVSNGDEDGGGVDGDGFGGNSPSRQGARIETSVRRISSVMTAVLQNFSWMDVDSFRVFASEALYRRKGDVRGWTRGPHHLVAQPRVDLHHPMCGQVLASLRLSFGLRLALGEIGTSGFISSNSENISYVTFLKHKNSRK
jgi:hypothetical protein